MTMTMTLNMTMNLSLHQVSSNFEIIATTARKHVTRDQAK